jgi:peptidoglycan/xylan/chitin deacetylase (PgdA/CDA1 family)
MKKLLALLLCAVSLTATAARCQFSSPIAALNCVVPTSVMILEYHEIVPNNTPLADSDTAITVGEFNAQMAWLDKAGFYTLTTSELAAYMRGEKALRPEGRPIVLSFDDGWYNQLNALPALRRHGFKATFNIISSLPGNATDYMDWPSIVDLQRRGHEIGGHTFSHPLMMAQTDAPKELLVSKNIIESKIGRQIKTMAWPNGYFTDALTSYARDVGYQSLQTIDENWCYKANASLEGTAFCYWLTGNFTGQDPYLMKRVFVDGRCSLDEFGKRIVEQHSSACTGATVAGFSFLRTPSPVKNSKDNFTDTRNQKRDGRNKVDDDNDGEDHGRHDERSWKLRERRGH